MVWSQPGTAPIPILAMGIRSRAGKYGDRVPVAHKDISRSTSLTIINPVGQPQQ